MNTVQIIIICVTVFLVVLTICVALVISDHGYPCNGNLIHKYEILNNYVDKLLDSHSSMRAELNEYINSYADMQKELNYIKKKLK